MAKTRVKSAVVVASIFYGIDDVEKIIQVKRSTAASIISSLRKELEDQGCLPYPQGKIPKKYFRYRLYLEKNISVITKREVMRILGVSERKAIDAIRKLRFDLQLDGYMLYPQGRISKQYFLERYHLLKEAKEYAL